MLDEKNNWSTSLAEQLSSVYDQSLHQFIGGFLTCYWKRNVIRFAAYTFLCDTDNVAVLQDHKFKPRLLF